MEKDLIDYLIENPVEIPATLKACEQRYGQHAARQFEAAIYTRKRQLEPQDTKGIAEMINAGTRAIAGDDYHFGTEVLEQRQTAKKEASDIAKMINQATADIISNPGMSPGEAITLGQLRRELQDER